MFLLQSKSRLNQRLGLTLVELLVVVTILMVLLGVVLPLASPNVKGRKLREAARQVNGAFASAKAKAEGTGQGAGVMIYPDRAAPDRAYAIAFSKSPNFFTGADSSSLLTVLPQPIDSIPSNDNAPLTVVLQLPDGSTDTASALQLQRLLGINVADPSNGPVNGSFSIRLNRRGKARQCNWDISTGVFNVAIPFLDAIPETTYPHDKVNDAGVLYGSAYDPPHPPVSLIFANDGSAANSGLGKCVTDRVPYQIEIPPKRSAAGAITLPTGTHIDLSRSPTPGTTFPFLSFGNQNPVSMLFDKSGQPDRVHRGVVDQIVSFTGLLIVDSDVATNGANVLDPNAGSMWVVVDNKTGQVKTVDNLGADIDSDGIFDQILVTDSNGDGLSDTILGDGNADGVADDANNDGNVDVADAVSIGNQALSFAVGNSKAGGR